MPAIQSKHDDLPTSPWNMPVAQLEQVASPFVLWPSEPYFPAIQAVPLHFAWPISAENIPAIQEVQVADVFCPVLGELLPVAHCSHEDFPCVSWKRP